jgi:hypothetical protein
MTDGEKADAMLRLADMLFPKFLQSRNLEFKVNPVICAMVVVFKKFLSDKRMQLDNWKNSLVYLLILAEILMFHCRFRLKPIQASEYHDSAFVIYSRKEMQALTGTSLKYLNLEKS